ncbi:MAG: histidine kinase dimerization/phospho-acceptor domain-containing protein [Candidatus Eiseniibacteriota bacterium]
MKTAHEIKNLLTTILGYAELLQRRIPSQDPLRSYVDEIARAAARAGTLSSELFQGKDGMPAAGEKADADPATPATR